MRCLDNGHVAQNTNPKLKYRNRGSVGNPGSAHSQKRMLTIVFGHTKYTGASYSNFSSSKHLEESSFRDPRNCAEMKLMDRGQHGRRRRRAQRGEKVQSLSIGETPILVF